MASCVVIVAIICVLLTTVATIVAFATPNWLGFRGSNDAMLCRCLTCDCGLWLSCADSGSLTSSGSLDNCNWFFTNDFQIERTLPVQEAETVARLPLKRSVVGSILLSGPNCSLGYFPFQPVVHNWFIKGRDWFKAVQGLLSCAVASSLLSLLIGLFSLCCYCKTCNPHQAAGAFINLTFLLLAVAVCVFGAKAHMDHHAAVMVKDNSIDPLFGWSFWVAVAAAGMSLFSSILYFCAGRKDEYQYN